MNDFILKQWIVNFFFNVLTLNSSLSFANCHFLHSMSAMMTMMKIRDFCILLLIIDNLITKNINIVPNLGKNRRIVWNIWICAGQMFLMNRFFDGAFLTFGIDVLRFLESDQEDRVDPMIYVFPRMTKCTFYKYGVSGEVERHDAVCILPLNVVNEKIYVFLWFWFLFLGVLSFITVLYRVNIYTYIYFTVNFQFKPVVVCSSQIDYYFNL